MLRDLLQREQLLIVPGVYDGLSARIAAQSGCKALYMSGFSVAAGAHGMPDIGLLTATEMTGAVGRIVEATGDLPLIADADNGYGGQMNVARTVQQFERLGVACLQLEDQVHPKRCGHMAGKQVVSRKEATEKIRTAVASRSSPDTLIMARTDSRATHDLTEALTRGEQFVDAGADILFIEAPTSPDEMAKIGTTFSDIPLVINLVEDGKTPFLDRATLAEMGFNIALFPISAILRITHALQRVYADVNADENADTERTSFAELNTLLGLDEINRLASDL